MSVRSATPLFVDTGAFYARADEDDANHDRARAVFEAVRTGELPFRPLYTSGFVLVELAGLIQQRESTPMAVDHVNRIWNSRVISVVHVDETRFAATLDEFEGYDDQSISFVDHSTAVLARREDVDHVFTFDPDDFETLGLLPVPRTVEVP